MFNGTGANVVGLQSMLPRWGAVIARDHRAHQRRRGRRARARRRHQAAQRADRRRQAHARAHRPRGLGLGRRAPRAAARRLDHADHRARHRCTPSTRCARSPTTCTATACSCTWTARASRTPRRRSASRCARSRATSGVDVLSFGGTKNGAMLGEAIVVLNPEASAGPHVPAQARHAAVVEDALRVGAARGAARRRPVAAQRVALQRHGPAPARAASRRASPTGRSAASRSRSRRRRTASSPPCPTASPTACASSFRFYDWDAAKNEVRWMCSFDTTEDDIDAFVAAIARETAAA